MKDFVNMFRRIAKRSVRNKITNKPCVEYDAPPYKSRATRNNKEKPCKRKRKERKMTLTAKETMLLKDMKDSEKLCIDKYERGSASAADAQLKNLFTTLAAKERTHLDTLTKIEQNGTYPAPEKAPEEPLLSFQATYSAGDTSANAKNDAYLCSDALSGEKHVAALYNTAIFEFKDTGARAALAHIATEEQQHGKMIYDYMSTNGMY